MKTGAVVSAALVALIPTAALADDPNDPAMRDTAARARDRAIIRQLNRDELARVRERDARYAAGWRAWRGGSELAPAASGHTRAVQDDRRAQVDYARERVQYQRDMARWRRAVAACRAGDYEACEG